MMGEVAMATQWLYIRPWKVLWLIFASIITHSLATTVSPTTLQRMSTKEVTTVLPRDLSTPVTSGNGLDTTVTTAQTTILPSFTTLTTQVTTSKAIGDGLTTLLPSTKVTSQTQQPTTSSSRTTSLSNQSTASAMPTIGTTSVKTMPLLSTTVNSATTIGMFTTAGSFTTVGSSTSEGSSTTIGLPTSIGSSSTTEHLSTSVGSSSMGLSSPMGMDSTLAISVTQRLTSEEQVSDITSDVISGTTLAHGGGSKLSVVHWFLLAVALAAIIFFLFICYHFCQVRRSKKDQTYANHHKNFIEYATPQSPKEKWRNSWALEAMIYHIELPQENSAEMEARDNVVFEEDETDASSSNHARPHLTKL